MLSTSYFSLPLHASHQPLSLRAAKCKPSRKRKRDGDGRDQDDDDDDDDDNGGDNEGDAGSSTADDAEEEEHAPISGFTPVTQRSLAALAVPVDAQQYRTAGQSFQEPLPDRPFPHRPAACQPGGLDRGRGVAAPRICQEELANLFPPLFLPRSSYTTAPAAAATQQHVKLRLHHLSVLTTIFHRCVLDGDFLRAGRAWGMILRAEFGGKSVHLRKEGRWGIGAEILLRRDTEISMLEGTAGQEDGGESSSSSSSSRRRGRRRPEHLGAWFTRQGFEKAKEYYERLALQYQFRKWASHSVSSLDFYPALFSTWIYLVQAEYKASQRGDGGQPEVSSLPQDDHLSGSEPTPSPNRQDSSKLRASEKERLRKKVLKEAEDIAERMDELMRSPPYSDSLHLWCLRGMVSLWISDICMAPLPTTDGSTDITGESTWRSRRRDYEQGLRRRKEEIRAAKAAFGKAGSAVDSVIWEGRVPFEDDGDDDDDDDDASEDR
ncbi:hypothetical protein GP486_008066 [Trichoglossum hirsutum]|uniref:Uncharacterized protein n=1 Tax=Trichoglossum hirsutum TaxID=265104 RepID=A0A9P8L235_9PEZI|nr:hypothetical protein GP486_008066 [Trichoglossum hirsutum]